MSVFTEMNFLQIFYLQFVDDIDRVKEYMPRNLEVDVETEIATLPPYHSLWYDVRAREVVQLRPVPELATILETFRRRLAPPEPKPEISPERKLVFL